MCARMVNTGHRPEARGGPSLDCALGKWEREGGWPLCTSCSHLSGTWKNGREGETRTCEQDPEPAQDGAAGVCRVPGAESLLSVWGHWE